MARYELGAIYKIDGGERTYYARLLTQDTYGVFEPINGEISEEKFSKLGYRLYICTGSFAVKEDSGKNSYHLLTRPILRDGLDRLI